MSTLLCTVLKAGRAWGWRECGAVAMTTASRQHGTFSIRWFLRFGMRIRINISAV